MNHYTTGEMADMHFVYGEAHGNSREAARIYAQRFSERIVPDPRTFSSIHCRLREIGSFTISRPNAGRGSRVNPEEEMQILEYFNRNPSASCRSAAAALGLTVWNVLNANGLHPFRFQRVQGLTHRILFHEHGCLDVF